jgi:hypothetical protein
MSARLVRSARRTRLFAVSAVALAATLSLTACNNGEGTKDAGTASASSSTSTAPSESTAGDHDTESAGESGSGTSGAGTSGSGAQQTSTGSGHGGKGSKGGDQSSTGTAGTAGTSGSDASTQRVRCDSTNIKVTAQVVSRPLNTMILTATNKGTKSCDLYYAPVVRFEGAQSVPPAMKDTQPQSVVGLEPGASGYAVVKLSSPTGTPDPGHTAKSLSIGFYDAQHKNVGGFADAALPAKGVYIDSSLKVSFWNSDLDDISSL